MDVDLRVCKCAWLQSTFTLQSHLSLLASLQLLDYSPMGSLLNAPSSFAGKPWRRLAFSLNAFEKCGLYDHGGGGRLNPNTPPPLHGIGQQNVSVH